MGKENHRSHRRRRKNDETRNERCIKRYKLEDLKLIMKKKSSREKEREKWKNTRRSSSITDKRVFLLIQNTKEFKKERENKPTDILNVSTCINFSRSSHGRVKFNHLKNWFRFLFSSTALTPALVLFHLLLPMLSYLFRLFFLCIPNAMNQKQTHTHNSL